MSEPNKLAQELYKKTQKPAEKCWSGAHTKHRLRYHLVFIPKYRKRVLEGKVAARLEALLRQACEVNRWSLEELAIQPDHVHLLVQIHWCRYSRNAAWPP